MSLYPKPKKKFTEIAKEFDRDFYLPHRDDNKCYMYMWQIYYMLASKARMFKTAEDYDNYASFAATTIYMRFIKKQKNGERIKSILNYAKNTKGHLKVMYQNSTFSDILDEEFKGVDTTSLEHDLKDSINEDYKYGLSDEINDLFKDVPRYIKEELAKSPYREDKVLMHRMYLSCLLSILNSITLSNVDIQRLNQREQLNTDIDELVNKTFLKTKVNGTLLFRLDSKYKDYITLITNKVRERLSKEFADTQDSFLLDNNVLDSIMKEAYGRRDENNEEEDY